MFDAVPIVTTKKIIENAQKKWRKESKCVTTKKKKTQKTTAKEERVTK